jgi:hypothetical protein
MTAVVFPRPGLTEQRAHIEALAESLSAQQLVWVRGCFAGFDGVGRRGSALLGLEVVGGGPERFGDFAVWAGHVTQVRPGRDFNA